MIKRLVWLTAMLCLVFTARADQVAHDEASNHIGAPYWQNWQNGHNGGFGFRPWQLWNVGSGGTFIFSSTQHGAGNVNSEGNWAFGMWANPVGNNHAYARRFFEEPLFTNQTFRMDIAPSSQAGTRGVSLLDANTNVLLTVNFGNNDYQVGGVSLGWTYAQNSVFRLAAEQVEEEEVTVTLTRVAETYVTNITGRVAGLLAFTGNSPSGGANNFYFNHLVVQGPEGPPPPEGTITIGRGPAIGVDKRGATWYQEFQDWRPEDVRALDAAWDQYLFLPVPQFGWHSDDMCRDLLAFYSRDRDEGEEEEDAFYFRVDLFNMHPDTRYHVNVYVAIDVAPGGQDTFPDTVHTRTDRPWEACVAVYSATSGTVFAADFAKHDDAYLGSYWNDELDAIEFGIRRSFLTDRGWDGSPTNVHFQVFTTRPFHNIAGRSDIVDYIGGNLIPNTGDGTGLLEGAIRGDATTGRAKYAIITHANQSVNARSGIQRHIYVDRSDVNLHPGFIRLLDSAEMFNIPINVHISGSLLISLLWAEQEPSEPGYPDRDGPTFLARVRDFVTGDGPGSMIGGVLAEHIMPYFEGEVNARSIQQRSELIEHLFGLTEEDMKVMHTPERVIRSDTNAPNVSPLGPLTGKTFKDIEDSGYVATYVDEVSHLHWWFYPDEQAGFTNVCNTGCNQWAGWMGCEDEPYHHKIHKINGVYTFMINDREDKPKFGLDNGGIRFDTRHGLLDKARHADQSQITIVFDDWEAYAGHSFASPHPNHNADQFHRHLRWVANHPWIELVNLRDILDRIDEEPDWVIDQGYHYDLTNQTYEWLKRATEHSYDNWYYGSALEESFFNRVPPVTWDGGPVTPPGMKVYGDMNTPGTILRDTWDRIQTIDSPRLKKLAEWSFSAMIYETAWHDEDANPDRYQSRNYQATFDRVDDCTESYEDTTWDPLSGWALKLHGNIRHTGAMKDVDDWLAEIRSGLQGPETRVDARDTDDDTLFEYILSNNRVYLCFERWGARLVRAFVYCPDMDDAIMVIGAPITNPPNEHENEGAHDSRCSGFKDLWSTGFESHQYIDMDFASTPPVAGSNSWSFTSADGKITKTYTLWDGRDVLVADYEVTPDVGTLYTRFGFGPNQLDLMLNGVENLERLSDPSFRGLRNTQGGEIYLVVGPNTVLNTASRLHNAGWDNREMALTEQFEIWNTGTQYRVGVAFALDSARDVDGDGLSNTNEWALGTDAWNPDSDGDGIPDGWEVRFGLDPLDPDDALVDSSGDGFTNYEKFVMNLDPHDSNAFLHVNHAIHATDGFRIDFPVSPPRHYRILYVDGLTEPFAWQPFANPNPPVGSWLATDPDVTHHYFIDDYGEETTGGEPAHGLRFYTIEVSVPE